MRSLFLILICGLACTSQTLAQTTWKVAAGPSSVSFNIQHLLFSEVEGAFRRFSGSVITTQNDFTDARIDATIPVSSIYTGNKDRDTHLLSDEFFDATHYPAIGFKSQSFKKTGVHTYKVVGALTIRGVTRTVELEARCTDPRLISQGRKRVDFTVYGSVNRYDYGLRWNEVLQSDKLLVGKMVEITLNIALIEDV